MEEASLNMLLKPESTTISRIRERRRERILRNSDQRIRSILGGLDGAELRNAPALEGGECFRNLVSPSETSIRNENNGEETAIKSILSSFSCTSVNRLWKALLVGLVMRLAVSFLMIENIIWPWIILYMLSACKKVFQLSSLHAAVGYFLHPRLHLGLNLLSYAGAVVQNIWCFIKESLMVALSFILFNALFCAFALIVGKCCLL